MEDEVKGLFLACYLKAVYTYQWWTNITYEPYKSSSIDWNLNKGIQFSLHQPFKYFYINQKKDKLCICHVFHNDSSIFLNEELNWKFVLVPYRDHPIHNSPKNFLGKLVFIL